MDSPVGGESTLGCMSGFLSIGDFARATQLSVKTLRNYHESGLLEPFEIDQHSGYRRYQVEQIPTAQVIRRFRNLDMPLDLIRAVLNAPDVGKRNDLIASHLLRLEHDLARTQDAVASLRDLLESASTADITHRTVPATHTAAISEVIHIHDASTWYQGALGELYATMSAQGIEISSPAGGVYSNELLENEYGQATVFLPSESVVKPTGRVVSTAIPAVELATTIHTGAHDDIDRAYGALGAYVTEHSLAVDGPVREYYLVGPHDTAEATAWRTEIGWPIFATAPSTA
ncbi:MAG: transcriptional regulator, MerR family [Frondihabitans sp.]|nr:transcriptional regulator, MerR family [Frondihabitans sp.]